MRATEAPSHRTTSCLGRTHWHWLRSAARLRSAPLRRPGLTDRPAAAIRVHWPGNRAHRYIGKVCCLLLVRADYIRPRPRARPRGHGELLKLLRWHTMILLSFKLSHDHCNDLRVMITVTTIMYQDYDIMMIMIMMSATGTPAGRCQCYPPRTSL